MDNVVGNAMFKTGAVVTEIGASDAMTGLDVGALLPAAVVSDIGAFVLKSSASDTCLDDGLKVGEFDGRIVSAPNPVPLGAGVTPACAFPKMDTILSNFDRLSSLLVGFPQSWQPRFIKNCKRLVYIPSHRSRDVSFYSPRVIMADMASKIVSSDSAPSTKSRILQHRKSQFNKNATE